jgi:hypothetical protein
VTLESAHVAAAKPGEWLAGLEFVRDDRMAVVEQFVGELTARQIEFPGQGSAASCGALRRASSHLESVDPLILTRGLTSDRRCDVQPSKQPQARDAYSPPLLD